MQSLDKRLCSQPGARNEVVGAAIRWLRAHRGEHSLLSVLKGSQPDETPATWHASVAELVWRDLSANLRTHAPVPDRISYKPFHPGVHSKADLAALLQRVGTRGLRQEELDDAEAGVQQYLEELIVEGVVVRIQEKYPHPKNADKFLLFFSPPELRTVRVDPIFRAMWRDTKVPLDPVELEEKLFAKEHLTESELKYGHLTKAREQAQLLNILKSQQLPRRKKSTIPARTMTNTHLIGQGFDFIDRMASQQVPMQEESKVACASVAAAASAAAPSSR